MYDELFKKDSTIEFSEDKKKGVLLIIRYAHQDCSEILKESPLKRIHGRNNFTKAYKVLSYFHENEFRCPEHKLKHIMKNMKK
jgi:hypothetical protein